ncbi:MAG: site-specific integrase [Planctomycetales bacterium]|nr:site-specific integrase [Planctomycetales bacterium]
MTALTQVARILTRGQRDALSLDWSAVRYQHVAAVRSFLTARYAPNTANKYLANLRSVLREAWRLGYISREELARATDVPPVRGYRQPPGRHLSAEELRALFRLCGSDPSLAGRRDAALLAVLYYGGLRASELMGLSIVDLDLREASVLVRQGKGNKDRLVYLAPECLPYLRDWLRVRGKAHGALFGRVRPARRRKGSTRAERPLWPRTLNRIVSKRVAAAGLRYTRPHDFRRTMIGDLMDAGVDLSMIARQAGHANVTTTQRYDRRGDRQQREAAARLRLGTQGENEIPLASDGGAPRMPPPSNGRG